MFTSYLKENATHEVVVAAAKKAACDDFINLLPEGYHTAFITILASHIIGIALPYLLAFAAGAMIYVVVEELMPEMSEGEHSNVGVLLFSVGFTLMMVLDVALG